MSMIYLIEATLTDSTSHRKAEMEPVSRHLIRNMQEYDNERFICNFCC